MFEYEPQQRFTLADLLGHPFLNCDIATPAEVKKECRKYRNLINSKVSKKEETKTPEE